MQSTLRSILRWLIWRRDSGKLISDETANRIYLWLQLLLQQRLEEQAGIGGGDREA